MAVLPINPNLLNVAAITAQQATNDGSNFLFTDAFNTWNDANQPTTFYVLGGAFFISIADYYASVIDDYTSNWM